MGRGAHDSAHARMKKHLAVKSAIQTILSAKTNKSEAHNMGRVKKKTEFLQREMSCEISGGTFE